jgi:hypothetical protein
MAQSGVEEAPVLDDAGVNQQVIEGRPFITSIEVQGYILCALEMAVQPVAGGPSTVTGDSFALLGGTPVATVQTLAAAKSASECVALLYLCKQGNRGVFLLVEAGVVISPPLFFRGIPNFCPANRRLTETLKVTLSIRLHRLR